MEGWERMRAYLDMHDTDMLIGGFSRNLLIWVASYMKKKYHDKKTYTEKSPGVCAKWLW